ncbi:hypothetical protein [Enterococcus mundtii]|uniref:Uncharacterized protein n=1 Tax=Enterococcus mundtii TaxID=53346 RepID=A0A242KGM5_ENTMU|nr:hypothetical protein [Enterococcus mundtii]OTP19938.1 hypothetical protein A5802_003342 [Enterococcus mundtii]
MINMIVSTVFHASKEVNMEIQGHILKLNEDVVTSETGIFPAMNDMINSSLFFVGFFIITVCLTVIYYKYNRKKEEYK